MALRLGRQFLAERTRFIPWRRRQSRCCAARPLGSLQAIPSDWIRKRPNRIAISFAFYSFLPPPPGGMAVTMTWMRAPELRDSPLCHFVAGEPLDPPAMKINSRDSACSPPRMWLRFARWRPWEKSQKVRDEQLSIHFFTE